MSFVGPASNRRSCLGFSSFSCEFLCTITGSAGMKTPLVATIALALCCASAAISDQANARRYIVREQPSPAMCDVYANNYAQRASLEGEFLAGPAFGAAGGFGLGSIFAAAGAGAAIGAGVGVII